MNGKTKTAESQRQTLRSPKQPGRKDNVLKGMTITLATDASKEIREHRGTIPSK